MRYIQMQLARDAVTGTDGLGNEVNAPVPYKSVAVMPGGWSAVEVQLLGREITSVSSKLILRTPMAELTHAQYLLQGSDVFRICEVQDTGRFRVVAAQRCKK